MNLATVERLTPSTDWVLLKYRVKIGALCVFCAAAGGWVQSIRDQAGQIPYMERSTTQLEHLKDTAGPNPAATVRCLKRRGDKAEDVATQAVISNLTEGPVPNLSTIPDCPTPKL